MLNMDGVEITVKCVAEIIQGEELVDAFKLKDKVVSVLATQTPEIKSNATSTRREVLEQYIVENWENIKDNEVVRTTLLNSYCMGRYKKDRREEMVNQLISLAEGGTTVATASTSTPDPIENNDSPDAELEASADTGDHRQYTF
jgi:hypothetical protein